MNTSTLYTIQITRPVVSDNNATNDDNTKIPSQPRVVKTLVEGTLSEIVTNPDADSYSIFTNSTIYSYYENNTMPVAHKTGLYSVPTSWITKYIEGGLDKWTA